MWFATEGRRTPPAYVSVASCRARPWSRAGRGWTARRGRPIPAARIARPVRWL